MTSNQNNIYKLKSFCRGHSLSWHLIFSHNSASVKSSSLVFAREFPNQPPNRFAQEYGINFSVLIRGKEIYRLDSGNRILFRNLKHRDSVGFGDNIVTEDIGVGGCLGHINDPSHADDFQTFLAKVVYKGCHTDRIPQKVPGQNEIASWIFLKVFQVV